MYYNSIYKYVMSDISTIYTIYKIYNYYVLVSSVYSSYHLIKGGIGISTKILNTLYNSAKKAKYFRSKEEVYNEINSYEMRNIIIKDLTEDDEWSLIDYNNKF